MPSSVSCCTCMNTAEEDSSVVEKGRVYSTFKMTPW